MKTTNKYLPHVTRERDPVPPRNFGRDHWNTLGYLEDRCVESEGYIALDNMRTDGTRHPQWVYRQGSSKYPTRLRGNVELRDHDDWDCLDDLWDAGLLRKLGDEISPRVELTGLGWRVAEQLRKHKGYGGTFGDFYWSPERKIE